MSDKKDKKNVDKSLSAAASAMGKVGGVKGGKKRAEVLSAQERSEISSMGGKARSAKIKATKTKLKRKKK